MSNLANIISSFINYIGYGGALSQKDLDQGDSSQRDGHFFALAGLLKVAQDFMGRPLGQGWSEVALLHEAAIGLYRRSPNPNYWGYNPNNFSRDQHSVLRLAMAVMGDTKRLKESTIAMIKRFGFHQNTHKGIDDPNNKWKIPDIMTPMEWAVIIRGLNLWYLYPVLLLLDATLFIDLALRKNDNWDQDNMLALNMLYSYKKYRTPCSHLAMKLYKRTNFMDRITNYYRIDGDNNGLAPMADLFKLAYEELT